MKGLLPNKPLVLTAPNRSEEHRDAGAAAHRRAVGQRRQRGGDGVQQVRASSSERC
jgi:hypothetical protein